MHSIALAQMEVVCHQPEINFQTMKDWIAKAKAQGADWIVFPELCVSGYMLSDRYLDHDYCSYVNSFNDRIRELSDGIGIIWGNIRYEPIDGITKGRDGRPIRLNCAFFARDGKWVRHEGTDRYEGFYIKHLNPDYRMFDDSRYFISALELSFYPQFDLELSHRPFDDRGVKIGLEVCEDLWSADYGVDMTQYYGKYGVDYVINVSASPWTKNKEMARLRQVKQHMDRQTIPYFVYVNQVGMANTGKNVFVFDGNSFVMSKVGKTVFANDRFEPQLLIVKDDLVQPVYQKLTENKLLQALVYAIRKFDSYMFGAKVPWVIGLSGGLDSSVSAALLVMALGPDRVIGYNMRTSYNSSATISNAQKLAERLGMRMVNGVISDVVTATKQAAIMSFGYQPSDLQGLVEENIQARIRGHMLSMFASIHGGVIANNGNKVEVALGYCTLYGDSIGALSVLGDLLKVDLFELSKDINGYFGKEVIPESLLPVVTETGLTWDIAPSAELRDNQLDPMKWFYHDALIDYLTSFPTYGIERFMERYLDGSLLDDPVYGRWLKWYGLDDPAVFIEDLEWVLKTMNKAVFKRIQMPPIITVSKGAFGYDLRESQLSYLQTSRYHELKQQILHMKK